MKTVDSNTNLNIQQSPQNHYFILEKFPDFSYSVTDVLLPDIMLGRIDMYSPYLLLKHPGSSLDFSDLTITFIVDEDLSNYLKLVEWCLSFKELHVLPAATQEKVELDFKKTFLAKYGTLKSDCELHILTNKRNLKLVCSFHDCFPISLSGLSFSTKMGSDPIVCDLTLTYNNYELSTVT
jgi:hypothetical protein